MSKPFKLIAAIMVMFIAACTQQSVPESSTYQGQKIQLLAEMEPSLFDAKFVLKVNGEVVIQDRTQPFGGSSQSFNGVYNGKAVLARATSVEKLFSSYVMVDVFINGELIDTLII